MNEVDLIVNDIVIIADTKGAERKEYLKILVSNLMKGKKYEDIKNIKNIKVNVISACCY